MRRAERDADSDLPEPFSRAHSYPAPTPDAIRFRHPLHRTPAQAAPTRFLPIPPGPQKQRRRFPSRKTAGAQPVTGSPSPPAQRPLSIISLSRSATRQL
jgi:hypothetical protein